MKNRHLNALVSITLLAATVGAAVAQEDGLPEPPFTFVGNAVSTGTRIASGSSRLQMTISRWSSDEEWSQLQTAVVEGGQQAVVDTLQSFAQAGFVRTGTGVGDPVQYARATRVEGGWVVMMVTDRPMGVFESYYNVRTMDWPLTVIELRLDEEGVGSGAAAMGVQLHRDPDTGRMLLERWDTQPIQIGRVRTR